jgi:hypothetical protein
MKLSLSLPIITHYNIALLITTYVLLLHFLTRGIWLQGLSPVSNLITYSSFLKTILLRMANTYICQTQQMLQACLNEEVWQDSRIVRSVLFLTLIFVFYLIAYTLCLWQRNCMQFAYCFCYQNRCKEWRFKTFVYVTKNRWEFQCNWREQ